MASRASLRTALRVSAAILGALAARPALACYCVEYCSSIESAVTPPFEGEEGEPQPNSYVVEITWTPYAGAPDDCQYTVEGSGDGGDEEWIPQPSCTVRYNESGEAYGADCVVTDGAYEGEDGEQPTGVTWTFRVGGDSQSSPSADSSCTTTIFLPGPLDSPPEVEVERESSEQVTIEWEAAEGRQLAGGSSIVQGYRIYRYTNSDASRTLIGTTTETRFVDQGASASESYTYEIYATDQYGIGKAAIVQVPGTDDGAGPASGGCSSGAAAAPLALALVVAGALWRKRRVRA